MNTQKIITGLDVAIRVAMLTTLALMSYHVLMTIKRNGNDDGDDWKKKRLKPLPTPPPVNKQPVFLIEKKAYQKVEAKKMPIEISEN